jgi:DnaJ-domain-containing protein 1
MENPFARVVQRGFQAMAEAMQEELGRMCQQLIEGTRTPQMLAPLIEMIQQSLGAVGFDIDRLAGTVGKLSLDPYRILGLDRSASDEEVRKRYHELLRKLHPDTSGTEGTSFLFQMVLAAYEMIRAERKWP